MSDISDKLPIKSHLITISQLSQNKIHKFSIRFDNNDLLDYKNLLDLRKISKVTIFGEISAEGNKNWLLNAKIGASVTQSCVVTMEDDLTIETISLNLNDFPRKDGIVIDPVLLAPEGIKPLTDDAVKPFAGLASLRDKLKE